PRILAYHSAERATSVTLITRWSSAFTLTGMAYPFVARRAGVRHWQPRARVVTTRSLVASTTTKNWSICNDFTPPRAGPDRHRGFDIRDRPRLRCGLSGASGAVPGRLSAGRRDRHPGAPDRPAPVGKARPAIRDRKQAGRRQQHRHRGRGERRA